MKLIWVELKKIVTSKLIFMMMVLLLMLNFILTLYTSRPQPFEKTVRKVYVQYLKSPEEMDVYYEELQRLAILSIREEHPNLPHTFDESGQYDDLSILRMVYERKSYLCEEYQAQIKKITGLTERKIDDLYGFGYAEDSYEVISQKAVLAKYEALLNSVDLGTGYSYGYDVYLKNNIVSVFVLLFLLLAVSYIFLNDRSVGFENILRLSKKGRGATFRAKLVTVFLITFASVFLFLATTFLATGIIQGFSSSLAPIQSLPAFSTVPYRISILEYLFFHSALRIVGFTVFSLLIALLAGMRLPYVFCFGGGAVFAGVNAFLYVREYLGTVPAIKYVNFAALVDACELTGFYRTLSLFGYSVSHVSAILVISVILCIVFIALCAVCYCRNIHLFTLNRWNISEVYQATKSRLTRLSERFTFRKTRKCLPLFLYELKKSKAWLSFIMIMILLLTKAAYISREVGSMRRYDQAVYYEYISEIQMLNHAARTDYMLRERARIDGIICVAEEKKTAFENGELDPELYYEYYQSLNDARVKDVIFERVENYVSYIDGKNAATGLDGKIIYSMGYEQLFGLQSDIFLYVALIFLCTRVFSVEYMSGTSQGGFSQILRTTKKGRTNTFDTKIWMYVLLGSGIAIAFRAVTFGVVANSYILPDLDAVLYSIQSFSEVSSGITIWQFFIIDFILQGFTGVVIASLICIISFAFKRLLAILSVTVLVIGIPEILIRTVLKSFSDFSILSLSSPQLLMCHSAKYHWFENDFIYLLLICLMYIMIVITLFFVARRAYCTSRYIQNILHRKEKEKHETGI